MKKILITILTICIVKLGFSQEIIVKSEIEKVIVFQKGAQVTRNAKTNIKAGKSVIIFDNLSLNINDESILVSGNGHFTILSVVNQTVTEDVNKIDVKEITRLNKISINLHDTLEYEKGKLTIYSSQLNLLAKLNNKFDSKKEFSLSDFEGAIKFQDKKLSEIKFRQFQSNTKIVRVQNKINDIKMLLNKISQRKIVTKKQIVVTVSSKTTVVANFKIGYYINNAGWNSSYDIRVKDIDNPVTLIHKANVYQNTGENWTNVLLTLSNGNPLQSGIKPNLQTWYLNYTEPERILKFTEIKDAKQISGIVTDRSKGEPIAGANIMIQGTSIGTITDLNGRFSVQAPKGSKALIVSFVGYKAKIIPLSKSKYNVRLKLEDNGIDEVVVTALGITRDKKTLRYSTEVPVKTNHHQTTVEFEIDIPYNIPSDGKKYSVQIRELSFPSEYQYYCVPKLDKDVFLIAKITNWEKSNISVGNVNLYFEGTYLGKSQLKLNGVKDTIYLSLGRDKNIKVERVRIKELNTNQFLTNKKTDEKGWEISIKNLKKQTIDILIEDQIPLSTIDEIKILPLELNNGILDTDSGKLKWLLKLKPQKGTSVSFKYSIKYPNDYKITANN